MKVWFKIQSFNQPFFKQTIIKDSDDVLKYIRHLYSTSSNTPQNNNLNSNSSPLQSSSNKPKTSLSLQPLNSKNGNQSNNNVQASGSNTDKFVTVIDEEGKSQKVSMLALYPSSNLTAILFPKKVMTTEPKPAPRPQFIEDMLTKSKSRIYSESNNIPSHLFINQPNIISAVLESSKPKQGQKPFAQRRSKILPVNDKIYIELLNQDVVSRTMDQDIAKSSGFQLQFKQLFQFFTNKFDLLMIDKQLFRVSLFAITSKFIPNELPESAQTTLMKQQVPLTNQKYMYALFTFFNQNQAKFWPYKQLSLMSILRIYNIFFDQCQYKLNILLDQEKHFIQKIQAIPFLRLPQSTLGRDFQSVMYQTATQETSESFRFRGHIFRILMNSKDQTRKLYKLPSIRWKFTQTFPQPKTTLEDLIEQMSSIGFKMSEIASLLKNFSLVLNLGLVQFTQQSFLKQDQQRQYSRIVETQAMGNIAALYTPQAELIRGIMLGQTNYKGESYQSIQVTSIKKQVLMRILWQQAINRFATEINLKVQNGQRDYSKMKRFEIFCHHNASLEESKINQEVVIQDGSMQSFEYTLVGAKIAEKQFGIQSNFSSLNNLAQIDMPSKLQKSIETDYINHLEKQYTSFNAKIIDQQRKFFEVYKQIRDHYDTKQIVKEIFMSNKVQTSFSKYFNEFFGKEEPSKKLSDNNYFICSDYWQFIHQQKEGPKVMDFFINVLKDQIQDLKQEKEVPHYNPVQNTPKSTSIISPYSPSKSQAKPLSAKQIQPEIKQRTPIKQEPKEKPQQIQETKEATKTPVKTPFKPAPKASTSKPIEKIEPKTQTINQQESINDPNQNDSKAPQVQSESKSEQKKTAKPIPKTMSKKQPQKIETNLQNKKNTQEPSKSQVPPQTPKPTPTKKAPQPLVMPKNQQQSNQKITQKQSPKPVTIGDVSRQTPKNPVIKSPKRALIRVQLPSFIKKYLYGDDLIQINRFFNSFNPDQTKPNPFQIQNIYKTMQKRMTDLHLFNQSAQNEPIPKSLQQMPLNQVNEAKELMKYDLHYDDVMQSFYIQASPALFNKIQAQNDLQKESVRKIIRLYRTFKWIRNDRLYFFRKHFLAQIHRRCRLRNFAHSSFDILHNRQLKNLKEGFDRIKNKYRLSKLNEASNQVIESDIKYKKFESLERLKGHQLKLIATQKMASALETIFQDVTSNVFRGLVDDQYKLVVTTPSGSKKNLDDLSIDVNNANQTVISHPGNTSTSNVKNLLSTNQKKSFSNKVTVPFDQEKFQQNTDPRQAPVQQDDQFDRSYTSSVDDDVSSSQVSQKSGTQPNVVEEKKTVEPQRQKRDEPLQQPFEQKPPEKDTKNSQVEKIGPVTSGNDKKTQNPAPIQPIKQQTKNRPQPPKDKSQKFPESQKTPVKSNPETQKVPQHNNIQPVKSQTQPTNPVTERKNEPQKLPTPKNLPQFQQTKPPQQQVDNTSEPKQQTPTNTQPPTQNTPTKPPSVTQNQPKPQQKQPENKQTLPPPPPPPPVKQQTENKPEPKQNVQQPPPPPVKPVQEKKPQPKPQETSIKYKLEPTKNQVKPKEPEQVNQPIQSKPQPQPVIQKPPQLPKTQTKKQEQPQKVQQKPQHQPQKVETKKQESLPKPQPSKQNEVPKVQAQKQPEPQKVEPKKQPQAPKQPQTNQVPQKVEPQVQKKTQPVKQQAQNNPQPVKQQAKIEPVAKPTPIQTKNHPEVPVNKIQTQKQQPTPVVKVQKTPQQAKPENKPIEPTQTKKQPQKTQQKSAKPQPVPVTKQQVKPEVKPQTKPEVKQQVKQQVKPEVKSQIKPQEKQEVKPQVKPQAKQEVKPEVNPEIKPEPKNETPQQNKAQTPIQPEVKTETKPVTENKVQTPTPNNTDKNPQQPKKVQEPPANKEQPVVKPPEVKEEIKEKPKQIPFKNQIMNEVISVANSGLSGSMVSMKSESADRIKKEELFQIKDTPFFSFESWAKDVGMTFPEKEKKACPILFRKYEQQKMKANEESKREIQEQRVIKQKIVNASFINYLKENLNLANEQPVESVFYFQKKGLEKPLLKHYDINKHGDTFKTMFNCILKISLFKNTSQKLFELLNTMIKPIKDAYNRQKANMKTVFDDQPLMNSSYELDYNVLRDEMFLQLAKQIMGNQDSQSVVSVIFSLDIITKNYYPSTKLFYPYLNHMKTNHVNKPDMFDKIYENLLKFAQAVEGYKGAKAKIYKDQVVAMTPAEYNSYLEMRSSLFYNQECQIKDLVIRVQLYNRERFEFKVGNESIKTIKKKLLSELGFQQKQKNFALYQQRGLSNYTLIDQKLKTVDYLSKFYQSQGKHRIMLRVKHYYPIRFKDINSLRMFYLNMIGEQVRMPFKQDDYQHIVAMSISFNEFQEDRISNFIVISKKEKLMDNDLVSIKEKLQNMTKSDSQKKICQFQYFKVMKQFKFLLAKVYKVTKQKQYFMDEVDRIVIKPKQLCMFSGTILKSSLSLFRIKSFYYENSQLHIDFIYSDRDLGDSYDKKFHGSVKSLVISDVYKIKELYDDIVYYTEMLHFGIKP